MHRQSSRWFILATSPTKIVAIHGSMIATTMRAACLIGVLVIIACLAETRAYVSFDQVNTDNSTVSADDLKKVEAETEKPKLIRVPLERQKSRRAIDGSLATINQNDAEKSGSATITDPPVPEDVAPDARQVAKRKHKKLKLSQTQGRKKSKKTKRYIENAVRQQLTNGNQNRSVSVGSRKDEKYYAQRKAIMDRYRARHREIARKYQQSPSTTTTTTEGPLRYDLGFRNLNIATNNNWLRLRTTGQPLNYTPPPQVLASTKPSTMPTLHVVQQKRNASMYDPDHYSEEHVAEKLTAETTTTTISSSSTSTSTTSEPTMLGDCKSIESLHMLYQHRLVLDTEKGISATAEILMPTVEGNCVVCIFDQSKVAKWQKGTDPEAAILKVKGLLNAQVEINLQFYTDPAKGRPCSDVRNIKCEIVTD